MSYACLIIEGHLGRDPEIRFASNGNPVANFSVAVSKRNKSGENTTTWFRCTCFGKTAEFASKYLKKGSNVMVQGEPSSRKFTDNSGAARESLEVTVNVLNALSRANARTDDGLDGGGDYQGGSDNSNTGTSNSSSARNSSEFSTGRSGTGQGFKEAKPSAKPKSFDDFDDDIPF